MLHKDETRLDFSMLLADVVTIADEMDAQLKQQMLRFMAADAAKLAKGNWNRETNESHHSALHPRMLSRCRVRYTPDWETPFREVLSGFFGIHKRTQE
jgi:hypothetical protein